MKTIFTAILAMLFVPAVFAINPVPANPAMKILQDEFPDHSNAVWFENAETYQVKFNESKDIRCWLIVNKKNTASQTLVRYYHENELPNDVRNTLYEEFPDSKISLVTEVNVDNRRVYQVNLETTHSWKVVRINDDLNTSIENTFRKA